MADNFTPEQIEQFLREFFTVVGRRQYIGARYVPMFGRKGESSIEWNNSAPYEPLTVVTHEGMSYTSRTYVPTGIDIHNTDYWAATGNYDSQVEQYRAEVQELENNVHNIEAIIPSSEFSSTNTVKKYIDEKGQGIFVAMIQMRNVVNNDWRTTFCASKNLLDWTPIPDAATLEGYTSEPSRPYEKDGVYYILKRSVDIDPVLGEGIDVITTTDFKNISITRYNVSITDGINRSNCWTPQIVEDAQGNTYIIMTFFPSENQQVSGAVQKTYLPDYWIDSYTPADGEDVSYCVIAPITINANTSVSFGEFSQIYVSFNGVDNSYGIDYDIIYDNGLYHMFYRRNGFASIAHATSENINGPYVIADWNNAVIFKDIALEAPVVTKVNDRFFINYQTFSREAGVNALAQSKDLYNFTFVGYPWKVNNNQFNPSEYTTHGQRPRNISPIYINNEISNNLNSTIAFVETGGLHKESLKINAMRNLPLRGYYYLKSGICMGEITPVLLTFEKAQTTNINTDLYEITDFGVIIKTSFGNHFYNSGETVYIRAIGVIQSITYQLNELEFNVPDVQTLYKIPMYKGEDFEINKILHTFIPRNSTYSSGAIIYPDGYNASNAPCRLDIQFDNAGKPVYMQIVAINVAALSGTTYQANAISFNTGLTAQTGVTLPITRSTGGQTPPRFDINTSGVCSNIGTYTVTDFACGTCVGGRTQVIA